MIANSFMYSNKEKELINSINRIDMYEVLKKETLSFEFVINYVLNEQYQKTRKEKDITIETVLNYQPHLQDKLKEL